MPVTREAEKLTAAYSLASPSAASASKPRLLGQSAVDLFQQSSIVPRDCGDLCFYDAMSHVLPKVKRSIFLKCHCRIQISLFWILCTRVDVIARFLV